MNANRTQNGVARLAVYAGALSLLVTGADHLDEYALNNFSTVPTIGTLFLLNFIAATIVGAGLLLPWQRKTQRFGDSIELLLALSGIAIASGSLIGLWISETSGLFGFSDYGFRATIVVAIVAELSTILALSAYLRLGHLRPMGRLRSQ
jgi:hypothetical protein